MASGTLIPARRRHEWSAGRRRRAPDGVVAAVAAQLHRLKEIADDGDSPLTALVVLLEVAAGLLVVVGLEMAVALAFYFGWL